MTDDRLPHEGLSVICALIAAVAFGIYLRSGAAIVGIAFGLTAICLTLKGAALVLLRELRK